MTDTPELPRVCCLSPATPKDVKLFFPPRYRGKVRPGLASFRGKHGLSLDLCKGLWLPSVPTKDIPCLFKSHQL